MSNSSAESPASAWFTPGRFAILLATLIVAFYPEVLLGTRTFVFRDYGIFGYPLAHYHREAFWRGEIPLWNPLSNCGLPFLAQWNSLTLYPPSLIYLLFPLSWSLGFFCLAHLMLAGMGMYFLAHRWTNHRLAAAVAGLAFAFNGLTLNCLMWPNNIAALGWMPWVILCAQQAWQRGGRKIIVAALIGALQMLAGAPEFIMFTWAIVGLLWLSDAIGKRNPDEATPTFFRSGLRLGLVVTLVTLLCAAQLLPFIDLLRHSQRDASFGGSAWSIPIWGWANLLVPLFRSYESPLGVFFQGSQDWTSSYYLGIGTLALALSSIVLVRDRRVWLLAALALVGLVFALGDAGHVHPLAKKVFPILGFIRFPVKFVTLAMMTVPLLAAFAIAQIDREDLRKKFTLTNIIVAGAFLLAIALIVFTARQYPFLNEKWSAVWKSGWSRGIFLVLIIGTALKLASIPRLKSQIIARVALLALIAFDGLTHAPQQNPTVLREAYTPGIISERLKPPPHPGGPRALMYQPSHDRVYQSMLKDTLADYTGRRLILFGNCHLLDNIPVTDGFYSLYLPAEREVWAKVFYAPTNQYPEALADFLCIAHRTDPVKLMDWETRPNYMPFATAGQRPLYFDATNSYQILSEPKFNPREMVLLPPEIKSAFPASNVVPAKVETTRFTNNKIELTADAAAATVVVLSQSFYHPWKAYVNGQAVPIWKANYAFQALPIPAGKSQIVVAYEDRMFKLGAIISAVTLFGCLGVCFIRKRKLSD